MSETKKKHWLSTMCSSVLIWFCCILFLLCQLHSTYLLFPFRNHTSTSNGRAEGPSKSKTELKRLSDDLSPARAEKCPEGGRKGRNLLLSAKTWAMSPQKPGKRKKRQIRPVTSFTDKKWVGVLCRKKESEAKPLTGTEVEQCHRAENKTVM